MAKLFNRAWMTVSGTPGTGTITLGSAFSNAYFTFAEAGVANTNVCAYVLEDGDDFEIGIGTYTAAGTTFSRDTVTLSKEGGTAGTAKITASSAATIFLMPRKEDLGSLSEANTWAGSQTFSAAIVYGGVTLSNSVTGTGSMVLSANPTFTGTVTTATFVANGDFLVNSGGSAANNFTLSQSGRRCMFTYDAFSGSFNGLEFLSNSFSNAGTLTQSDTGLPSWFFDLGGRGAGTPTNNDELTIGRVAAGGAYSTAANVLFRINAAGAVLAYNPTGGLGYATGAGGAVTQATSRTTGVTLNKVTGAITLVSAAGSATFASFTVTNSAVAATDTILVNQKSGTDLYEIHVTAVGAGSFRITSRTTGGTTTEQPVFNFAVIKAVAS